MFKGSLQKRGKVVLVLVTFCLVFFITYTLNERYIKQNVETVRVVTVTQKIPPYTLVTEEAVGWSTLPVVAVPADAVDDLTEFFAENEYYTNELGFGVGDILRKGKLAPEATAALGRLARLADEQTMLVALETNLVQSCANLVVPGALVQAVVYLKARGMDEEDQIISVTEEAGLAHFLVVDKKNANAAVVEAEGREAIPAVVVLQLSKSQQNVAKALVKYNEIGTIYLLPVGFREDVFLSLQAQN